MKSGTTNRTPAGAATVDEGERFVSRWPVHLIVGFVGLFCAVVGVMWFRSHIILGDELDATAWVVAGATLLRIVTILIALASIQQWGARLAAAWVTTGLWGCAAAQLVYPLAELVVKFAVLAGVVDVPSTGVGNMSGTGWFNLAMTWLIFGVPGGLFVLAARSYRNRVGGPVGPWPAIGLISGVLLLFGIGFVIG